MINQQRLFFIIGIGRSGTTLLQEIMNTFSEFCNVTESNDLQNMISYWTPVRQSNDFVLIEKFIKKNRTSKYFVEKTPDSILCLVQLHEKFPKSNYIFLERDPMKIILSQITLPPKNESRRREYLIKNLIMDKTDLKLNKQQFWAKLTLKQVKAQVSYKNRFQNSVIIRYDNLIQLLDSHLKLLEDSFNIKANFKEAKKILSKPSKAPKSIHEVTKLTDEIALDIVSQARHLWGY